MKQHKKGPISRAGLLLLLSLALSACLSRTEHVSFGLNLERWTKGGLGISSKLATPLPVFVKSAVSMPETTTKPVSILSNN
jgi:hypothetical protein